MRKVSSFFPAVSKELHVSLSNVENAKEKEKMKVLKWKNTDLNEAEPSDLYVTVKFPNVCSTYTAALNIKWSPFEGHHQCTFRRLGHTQWRNWPESIRLIFHFFTSLKLQMRILIERNFSTLVWKRNSIDSSISWKYW